MPSREKSSMPPPPSCWLRKRPPSPSCTLRESKILILENQTKKKRNKNPLLFFYFLVLVCWLHHSFLRCLFIFFIALNTNFTTIGSVRLNASCSSTHSGHLSHAVPCPQSSLSACLLVRRVCSVPDPNLQRISKKGVLTHCEFRHLPLVLSRFEVGQAGLRRTISY